jgi:hypothetical protein
MNATSNAKRHDPDRWPLAEDGREGAGTWHELVMLSDGLWSVLSPTAEVEGTSVVLRGPLPRGGYRVRAVIGDGVGDEDLST